MSLRTESAGLINKLILCCFIFIAAMGSLALTGWLTGLTIVSSFMTDWIPMAPSTALCFILFGFGTILSMARVPGRFIRICRNVVTLTGILIAGVLLVLNSFGVYVAVERLGFPASGMVGGSPVGHMSPVSALFFLLSGLAVLSIRDPSGKRSLFQWLAVISLCFVLLGALFFLVPYFMDRPLFYEVSTIPPAVSTLVTFLVMSAGLLVLINQRLRWRENMKGTVFYGTVLPILAGFVGFTILLFFFGYSYFMNYETEVRNKVVAQLESVARLKAERLSYYYSERQRDAKIFQVNPRFVTLVDQVLTGVNDTEARRELTVWFENYREAYLYHRFRLLDTTGGVVLEVPGTNEPVSDRILSVSRDVIRSRSTAFIDLDRDPVSGSWIASLLVPIGSVRHPVSISGILDMEINAAQFIFPMLLWWPASSKTAETVLVQRKDPGVGVLNPRKEDTVDYMFFTPPFPDSACTCFKAASGRFGVLSGTNCEGLPVIAFATKIQGSSWILITRQAKWEVYEGTRTGYWMLALVLILTLAVPVLGIGMVWRNQRASFYKKQLVAEQTLRESEEKFTLAFRQAPIAISISTLNEGRYIDLNEAFTALTGYAREEAIGRTSTDLNLMNPESRQSFLKEFVVSGRLTGRVMEFSTKDTRTIFCLVSVETLMINGEPHLLTMAQDITKRRRLEQSLRISEERFRNFFEKDTNYCYVISPDGLILDVNPSALSALGYQSKEELAGKPLVQTIYSPASREKAAALFAEWKDTGRLTDQEMTILTKTGEERTVILNASALRNEAGEIIHSVSIQTDITDMKRLVHELRKEMARLELMNENMVDRELKMIELKAEIKRLKDEGRRT